MAALFDYKDVLSIDDKTATDWASQIELNEKSALLTARNLNPNLDESVSNLQLELYCKEVVFMRMLGDNLSSSLYYFHTNKISEYEEGFRYGLGGA